MSDITAHTSLYGVIGDPISHSRSPQLHNAAFGALGIDAISVAFRVHEGDLDAALRGLVALSVRGVSVTMPHKTAVLDHADIVSETAARLGAANCLTFHDGRVSASNTDGAGFLAGLAEASVDPAGKRCAVIGAGGAARAVVLALASAGADSVMVINRSLERARDAAALAGECGKVGVLSDLGACDVIVNATPLGMAGTAHADADPLDGEAIRGDQVVCDLVYNPVDTALLQRAREAGATAVDGLAMLLFQAALQLQTWTGVLPPTQVLRTAAGSIEASW